jgi:hypothetical protein
MLSITSNMDMMRLLQLFIIILRLPVIGELLETLLYMWMMGLGQIEVSSPIRKSDKLAVPGGCLVCYVIEVIPELGTPYCGVILR